MRLVRRRIMEISSTCIVTNENYPWLIMIHGFGGTKNTWKHQVEEFRNFFNLMLVELPGHGETHALMSDNEELGFDDIADAVVAEMRENGIEKAHFMCVSLGTLVLASLVKRHPEMVESAVMCGAVFGMAPFHKALLLIGKFLRFCVPYKLIVRMFAQILMPLKAHKKSRKFLVRECFNLSKEEFIRWYLLAYAEINLLIDNIALFQNIKSLVVMGSEDHVFM